MLNLPRPVALTRGIVRLLTNHLHTSSKLTNSVDKSGRSGTSCHFRCFPSFGGVSVVSRVPELNLCRFTGEHWLERCVLVLRCVLALWPTLSGTDQLEAETDISEHRITGNPISIDRELRQPKTDVHTFRT